MSRLTKITKKGVNGGNNGGTNKHTLGALEPERRSSFRGYTFYYEESPAKKKLGKPRLNNGHDASKSGPSEHTPIRLFLFVRQVGRAMHGAAIRLRVLARKWTHTINFLRGSEALKPPKRRK